MTAKTMRMLLLAALVLPVLGITANILHHERALGGASIWRIPITGYDPRDPLRGQYLAFSYGWQVRGDERLCDAPQGCDLCLDREAGQVTAHIVAAGNQCAARVDLKASQIRVLPGFRATPPRFTARIYVSETSAPELEAQLRDRPMQVVAALTTNGRLVSRRVEAVN